MLKFCLLAASVFAAAALSGFSAPTMAQQSKDWFIPSQGQRPAARPAAPHPAAPPVAPQESVVPGQEGVAQQPVQIQLPPPPDIPALPKGPTPPAAIVGVLSVPDVLHASAAFQQADKEIGARRKKLQEDAQKEQIALRDLGQALTNERTKLSPEQIRAREKELQDRITESRRSFGERNRIIQEASQYVMAQLDRAVELVTQQVALSRGVNIVLNRAQILGTTNDFDLTPQVVESLNKVLPQVDIPPDGVSPLALQEKQQQSGGAAATPAAAVHPAPAATPKPPAKPPATTQHR